MDLIASRDTDPAGDLESGEGTTSEEDTREESVSSPKQPKAFLAKVCYALGDQSAPGEYGVNSSVFSPKFSEGVSEESVKLLADSDLEGQKVTVVVDKELSGEQCKKKSAKKAPKPPRPPRGPSLDAADQILIREINEHALLKRARIGRLKTLKKMKAISPKSSSSSSNSNLLALVFTILFLLVIFFQGMSTRSSPVSFHGSPETAAGTDNKFITVQYPKIPALKDIDGSDSGSPSLAEQVSGLEPGEKVSEVLRSS